ncbi:MAG: DUF3592 domain-containing protein [Burkholderiales bacterium]
MKITETTFVVVGLALFGSGGAWYYYDVERPLSWPRVEAVVVSSRVINPLNPNQHKPELVLHLQASGGIRQVTITGRWDSSSYDMVKSHVDRYPAGARIEAAVNPENDADVRYALGRTGTNLIGPGVVGFMGILFAGVGIGMWARDGTRRKQARTAAKAGRTVRAVAATFGVIGIVILVIGIWLLWLDLAMLRSWMAADAESIAVRPVASRTSVGNRPSTLVYGVQATFRYEVNGTPFESQAMSGSSSSTQGRDELMQRFAAGTRHQIRYRPGDPNVIRHGLDYSFSTFMLSGGMVLMGLVFIGFAVPIWRSVRASRAREAPDSIT